MYNIFSKLALLYIFLPICCGKIIGFSARFFAPKFACNVQESKRRQMEKKKTVFRALKWTSLRSFLAKGQKTWGHCISNKRNTVENSYVRCIYHLYELMTSRFSTCGLLLLLRSLWCLNDARVLSECHQWVSVTGRQPPPLSSVLSRIIYKRRSVVAAQVLLREKSGA